MALEVVSSTNARNATSILLISAAFVLQGCSISEAESFTGTNRTAQDTDDERHDASKCSDDGRDCCEYHQTCDDGYVARPDPYQCEYTTYAGCKDIEGGKYCYGCFRTIIEEPVLGPAPAPSPAPGLSPGPSPSGPLKVLALHGITGRGADLLKLGSIPGVRICNPTGPHAYGGGWSWWSPPPLTNDDPNRITDFAGQLAGHIDQHCGGFVDVMVGHSQGGYAISALLGSGWKDQQQFKHVRGVVMLSTGGVDYFRSADANLKSLHMFDPTDRIVKQQWSKALANKFTSPQIIQHRCGHMEPLCQSVMNAIPSFLDGL